MITTDLRLNEPRFISLPNIVQAKRKTIDVVALESLNVDVNPRFQVKQVVAPEKRRTGVKLASIAELVAKLKNEAQVL